MKKKYLVSLLALLAAYADGASDLGDAAKPLSVQEWIKNGPVKIEDGKGTNIYVVEFWATWCPPCLASIPHLTELQKKYKDRGVIVVGLTSESPAVVKKFVEKMGDQMDYHVAIDDGKTEENYPEAFGVRGIPVAFVVDKDGTIKWWGRPLQGLSKAVERIVDGKLDLATAKKEVQDNAAAAAETVSLANTIETFLSELSASNAPAAASTFKGKVEALNLKTATGLSQVATLFLNPKLPLRNPQIALEYAKRATEASGGKTPALINLHAAALFESGKFADAIARQKTAVELEEDVEVKASLKKILDTMEAEAKESPKASPH
ncbi:MAG: Thiol-disulfide oxidoreductase ResA [Verrucomicrobiota bacterium]|jgi:thiol-disulfide isomerase/thioredoxin